MLIVFWIALPLHRTEPYFTHTLHVSKARREISSIQPNRSTMAFTERDLFHRRPAASSTSIRKAVEMNNNCARRKKRSSSKDQFVATRVMILGITIPLALLLLVVTRRGGERAGANLSKSDEPRDGSRFLKQWKPRLRMSDEKVGGRSIMHNNDEKSSASKRANHEKLQADPKDDSKSIYRYKFSASELGYDIYHCPPTPPEDYPRSWPVTDIISNWNPNDVTTIPPSHREVYHSFCIFDYQTQYETALAYRNAEKPFVSQCLNSSYVLTLFYLTSACFFQTNPI